MRVALTGTPGTGKSTVAGRLSGGLDVVDLNELIRSEGLATGEDPERGSLVADLGAIRERLAGRDDVVVESHLAHHLAVDLVVVLRCHPRQLHARLIDRGESEAMATENAEAEALDVVLAEAVDAQGLDRVYELDTTDRTPDAVAADVDAVVAGDRDPTAGIVDFTECL